MLQFNVTLLTGDEKMKTKPMVMLLTMLAGWMNRQQQEIIEYLKAENAILRDELQKATGKAARTSVAILFMI